MAKIEINVTLDDNSKQSAKISGQAASAGIDTFSQWMATQKANIAGDPKFASVAEGLREVVIGSIESMSSQFPSAATKADADEIDAKIAALQAKRAALFAAARGEK